MAWPTAAERATVAAGLRTWAKGCYPQEAGVELLLRVFNGALALPGLPWVRPTGGANWWVDASIIAERSGGLSGGERRVLAVVAALVDDQPVEDLGGIMCGVDRDVLALILAALAHAGGSHEHADFVRAPDGTVSFVTLPALVQWPSPVRAA